MIQQIESIPIERLLYKSLLDSSYSSFYLLSFNLRVKYSRIAMGSSFTSVCKSKIFIPSSTVHSIRYDGLFSYLRSVFDTPFEIHRQNVYLCIPFQILHSSKIYNSKLIELRHARSHHLRIMHRYSTLCKRNSRLSLSLSLSRDVPIVSYTYIAALTRLINRGKVNNSGRERK